MNVLLVIGIVTGILILFSLIVYFIFSQWAKWNHTGNKLGQILRESDMLEKLDPNEDIEDLKRYLEKYQNMRKESDMLKSASQAAKKSQPKPEK